MNKKLLSVIIFCTLLILLLVPPVTRAAGLVPCTNDCTIDNFMQMLGSIYKFIVMDIATPLAVLALTIGGIMILISAGNANLLSKGKTILYSALIGLALALCSYLIISWVLTAVGYSGKI